MPTVRLDLAYHGANQRVRNGQLQTSEYPWASGGQHYLGEQISLTRAHEPKHIDDFLVYIAHARIGIEKHQQEHDGGY